MTDNLIEANNYYLQKDYNNSIQLYTKIIESGDDYKLYTNRSMAYFHLKNYKESLRDCTKAIRLNPKYSKLWGRLGAVLNKLKKYEESLIAYEKAMKLCENGEENKIYLDMINYINFKKLYENVGLYMYKPNAMMNNMLSNMTNYIANNPSIIDKMMDSELHNKLSKDPLSILQDKDLMTMFNNIIIK